MLPRDGGKQENNTRAHIRSLTVVTPLTLMRILLAVEAAVCVTHTHISLFLNTLSKVIGQ